MPVERIVNKEDTQYKIVVRRHNFSSELCVWVHKRNKGKRSWLSCWDENSHKYRCLDRDGRRQFKIDQLKSFGLIDEVNAAVDEFWVSNKPKLEQLSIE